MPVPVLTRLKALLPLVIKPANESAPELLTVKVAAGPLSVTVPEPVTLPTCWTKPSRSSVPPSVKAVPAGKALATPSARVPAMIVVAPVYVLASDSVSMPVPVLTRLKALLPLVIRPANESAPELLTVKVAAAPLSVTMPEPLTPATSWPKPARSRLPLSVKTVPVGKALATPSARVPAMIVVAPV